MIDYEALNSTLLYKTIEKQRIQKVNEQQKEFIQKVITEENKKLKQIYEESEKEQNEWLKNRMKNEEKLLNEIEEKTKFEMNKYQKNVNELHKKTDNQLKMIAIDGILKYQKRFKMCYENMVKLMKSASLITLPNCEEYNNSLKKMLTNFEELKQKVKNEIIGPIEVKSAENLCLEIEKLEQNLIKDIENYEKNLNRELQEVRNQTQKMIEEQKIKANGSQQNTTPLVAGSGGTTVVDSSASIPKPTENNLQQQQQQQQNQHEVVMLNFVNAERLEFYNMIMKFYTSKVESVKALQADDSMKKYRFACQKAINTPVNAISGVSSQHLQVREIRRTLLFVNLMIFLLLQDKFDKIFGFIIGNPLKNTDGSVISTGNHPLGRDYCLLLLAKKFVVSFFNFFSKHFYFF